jgi:hypothetical protein
MSPIPVSILCLATVRRRTFRAGAESAVATHSFGPVRSLGARLPLETQHCRRPPAVLRCGPQWQSTVISPSHYSTNTSTSTSVVGPVALQLLQSAGVKNFSAVAVRDGVAVCTVADQFELRLTLFSTQPASRWKLVALEIFSPAARQSILVGTEGHQSLLDWVRSAVAPRRLLRSECYDDCFGNCADLDLRGFPSQSNHVWFCAFAVRLASGLFEFRTAEIQFRHFLRHGTPWIPP